MRCPECGTLLKDIQLSETDHAYRCFKCGGFWIDSWAVNRLAGQTLAVWQKIAAAEGVLRHGTGLCPADGLPLKRYSGESVPHSLAVRRCDRCGKWWFGGNSLFDYKPAQEAKVKYFQLWGLAADVGSLLLPITAVIILAIGLYFGLELLRSRQNPVIEAVEKIIR